jgi:membrane-bound metal-dependent hydrolase YbcI (DUF457 family)
LAAKVNVTGRLLPLELANGTLVVAMDAGTDVAGTSIVAAVDDMGRYTFSAAPRRAYRLFVEPLPERKLARTPLGRAGRGTTAALVLASNAPDIDIVASAGGALKYLEWHRGPTHGALGIVGLGIITAALVVGGRLVMDRRPAVSRADPDREVRPQANASFARLAAVSILGVLLHVLMDLPTSYGSRLLSPFDWHWHALDWMPIVDLYLLAALAAGLFLGRASEGARRRYALLVLTLMAANYGLRAATHERAIALAPRMFGPLLPRPCIGASPRTAVDRWPRPSPVMPREPGDRCVVEIAATPGFTSPFEWRIIVQLSNAYYVRTVNVLDLYLNDDAGVWRLAMGVPNVWTPAVFKAAEALPARVFLGFSRFPAARVSVDHEGVATVQWTDMRFSGGPDPPRPQNDGRGDLFGATVRVGHDGRILHAQLGGR